VFDLLAPITIQTSVVETTEVTYKPIASVEQSDLPTDKETYVDLIIKLYIRGKLTKADGTNLENTEFTAVTNNLLHSLFSQCSISLNGLTITQATELYNYRSYFETLLTYGSDAATTHLTNAFWYLDDGDLLPCDPTAADAKNKGFITRWKRIKQSKEVQLSGRIHSDICNVPLYLIPGVRMQIKLTKAMPSLYLMNKDAEKKMFFKFLDARLLVNRVRPSPSLLLAHNIALGKGALARYNLTRVELKSFTFSSGAQSLSIDNAVLGTIPKRLLFIMVKNTEFLGSVTTKPYHFRHYDLSSFALNVNCRQVPTEGLSLGMDHEKTSVMGYRTLFEVSGIQHSNSGLQITHDMYISGYFMLLFDLTPDRAASEGHTSHPNNGNIRVELKFSKPLPEPITCIFYLEYNNSVRVDASRTVTTDF